MDKEQQRRFALSLLGYQLRDLEMLQDCPSCGDNFMEMQKARALARVQMCQYLDIISVKERQIYEKWVERIHYREAGK